MPDNERSEPIGWNIYGPGGRFSHFIANEAKRLYEIDAEAKEAMIKEHLRIWLPRGLRWLRNHPRLLRLYLLPFPQDSKPVMVNSPDGSVEVRQIGGS